MSYHQRTSVGQSEIQEKQITDTLWPPVHPTGFEIILNQAADSLDIKVLDYHIIGATWNSPSEYQ
jgi:hypothetical protein